MDKSKSAFGVLLAVVSLCLKIAECQVAARQGVEQIEPVLWKNPADIASRDLFYGSGGQENKPHAPFSFVEEDLSGTNPKLHVRDRDGVKWL